MRHALSFLNLIALAAALLAPAVARPAAPAADARVIVTFKADAPLARRATALATDAREGSAAVQAAAAQLGAERESALGQRLGIALRAGGHVSPRTQVFFARGLSSKQLVARLAADAEVESVVVDRRRQRVSVPNDPLYPDGQPANPGPAVGQWYLRAPDATFVSAINAEGAWAQTLGKPSVIVAVLDTGVRFDHADLAGKLLPGYDFISDAATANDRSGPGPDGSDRDSDPSDPGDWVTSAESNAKGGPFSGCTVENSSWHGTETASIVGAATDNGIGMASVGRNVRVLPLRVLGKCGGYDSDIQAAMRWAAGLDVPFVPHNPNKAAVINLSLGSPGACDASTGYPAVISEVLAAGTTIVAAAGNSAGHAVGTPAGCAGVIAVGALRHAGSKVGYSDVGPEIAISAPGGNCVNTGATEPCLYPIITARNSGKTTPVAGSSIYSDSYNASVGTSFSAPMVAGTVALMASVKPTLTPLEVQLLLQETARAFPTSGSGASVKTCTAPQYDASGAPVDQGDECICTTGTCGAGMLDAGAAVRAVIAGVPAPSVHARIDISPVTASAGQVVQLTGSNSIVAVGRNIVAYRWALVDGGGVVDAIQDSSSANATVLPSDMGPFTVSLTVTDSAGSKSTSTVTVVAGAAVASSSGGGGGGMSLVWLALLAAAAIAVARSHARRGAAAVSTA